MNGSVLTDFESAPFDIIDGDRSKNYPKQNEFWLLDHCLFLSATNVTRNGFEFSDCLFISEQKDELLRKGKLRRGDVVLTTRGTIGNVAYYSDSVPYDHMRINSGMVILRCEVEKLLPTYLYHFLRSPSFHGQVNSLRSGVAQPQLPIRDMKRIKLPLPPLPEQRCIVSILSAYDNLIENNRRRIQLLEQSARLLYKEWFVHLRFPGHEHTKITNGVPEGWDARGMIEHPYFELIRENIGAFDGQKRYYATADISSIFITGEGTDYFFEEKPSRAQKSPEIGSVWFARMQETYKVLVFTEANRDIAEGSILSSGFVGFRARQPEFLPFLYYLINNARFHEEKDRFCSGSTQRSLTDGGLKGILALTPTTGVIGTFAELTSSIIDQMLILQSANRQLMTARDLLLPSLMSGDRMAHRCQSERNP